MNDSLYTNNWIKKIIDKRKEDIVSIAVSKDARSKIPKFKSIFSYLISLLLIMDLIHFKTINSLL